MRIKAHYAMVLNLDKCIGCHTCSIPCKNVWTNRQGVEYAWFNNVETKPGIGYPKRWEDQELHRGGWKLGYRGHLKLRAGGRGKKMAQIFHNPDLPAIDEYYEPWTYDYGKLIKSPAGKHQPSVRPKSQITGETMDVKWGPNWEDDLAGVNRTGALDINFRNLEHSIYLKFKQVFMFYLPRLCEHCLNPGCVASCPSGAMYKREEDGIVLVDQNRCRGWRYCVSGCPYKKVYYNWVNGRSEKCIFCYPRIEAGLPTLCAQTCVGRIRYVGVVLYDADGIRFAASQEDEEDLYPAHTAILLNPNDPAIQKEAEKQGIPPAWRKAAQRSPVYKLAKEWKIAFPLHPEYRTLPMVWYIPPLSPVSDALTPERSGIENIDTIDRMRIPITYLANLLTAGDEKPVRMALKKLMAVRAYMRGKQLDGVGDADAISAVNMTPETAEAMYELLAIARYENRFVIPTVERTGNTDLYRMQGSCGIPGTVPAHGPFPREEKSSR